MISNRINTRLYRSRYSYNTSTSTYTNSSNNFTNRYPIFKLLIRMESFKVVHDQYQEYQHGNQYYIQYQQL